MTTENQAGKLVATLPDELDDSRSQGRAGGGGEADREDTYKDQTAEVVVFRQDDTALLSGEAQDDLIGGAWGRFVNSLDVVSRRTEGRSSAGAGVHDPTTPCTCIRRSSPCNLRLTRSNPARSRTIQVGSALGVNEPGAQTGVEVVGSEGRAKRRERRLARTMSRGDTIQMPLIVQPPDERDDGGIGRRDEV